MPQRKDLALAVAILAAIPVIVTPMLDASAASKEEVIHNFNGKNGSSPADASLVADSAGNLYGTAYSGGAFISGCGGAGCGTVFELMPAGNEKWVAKTLHNFGRGTDGENPNASLILDSKGNLYGNTYAGGTMGFGTVFMLTPDSNGTWKEQILHNFSGGADGGYPDAALVFDASGNLYGSASGGGFQGQGCQPNGCGIVFKLRPTAHGTWTETVLYTFAGAPDGATPFGGVIFDNAGNLYGTTSSGGMNGSGTVFELIPTKRGPWEEVFLYNFGNSGNDGAFPVVGLTSDAAGNLYGTTLLGGNSPPLCQGFACGTVFELKHAGNGMWTEAILYNFTNGIDGGGPGALLIFDAAGNLYSTAMTGGSNRTGCGGPGCGTVFKLKAGAHGQWTEKTLHSFGSGKDGSIPLGVIFATDGNLYGTTATGGSSGVGTVFALVP